MKKFLLVVLVIVLLLAVSGAVIQNGRQPEAFPEGSRSAALLQPGPMAIHMHEEVFIDDSRPTQANGDYAGDSVRRLDGKVWHPASNVDGPYPLIVYSHGFTSNRDGGAYLAEQLASLGYVVISVNYPLTNFEAPGGPNVKDVVNQPADVSFLIDSLVRQSNTAGHMLEGMVDESRVGVTGISLGGMTTALVSFHPEMRDPRIGAALSIAGPTSLFTETFFSHARVPFLMLAGDIDAMVPYVSNAAPVTSKIDGAQLVTLTGASHTGFSGPSAPLRWLNNPDAIGCYMVKQNVEDSLEDPWFELIGSPEQGIDHNTVNELCEMDPLPEAMNILRQQMITSVVVSSFFESIFAPDASRRDAAQAFLSESLAGELPDVDYLRAEEG
jgi:predicted dienelactone hydrolase